MPNYDASVPGTEYTRFPIVELETGVGGVTAARYSAVKAVVLTDGTVRQLEGGTVGRFTATVTPAMWGDSLPMVVNPTTGATSGTTTWGAIMLHNLSGLHELERLRLLPPPDPTPEPAP